MSPTVVLVGLPATGKSTVGALLADGFEVSLVDVAERVETRIGGSTAEFLATAGEAAYRAVEAEVALAALAGDGVVALSSGAVDDEDVRTALVASGPVIWLQASVQSITRRLGMNALGMDALVAIRQRMDAMLAQRAGWYQLVATATVVTDRLSPAEVAAAVETTVRGEP